MKTTEESLRQSEARFRALVEDAGYIVFEMTAGGVVTYISPNCADITGFDPAQLVGRPLADLVDPEDLPRCLGFLALAVRNGEKQRGLEARIRHGSGGWRWFSANVLPLPGGGAGGAGPSLLGLAKDITESKASQKTLIHSHGLMRYIIEHSRSAIAVHDRDLRYLYFSQRYLDEYEVADRDIIGKHHYEVFPDLPRKWRVVHEKALAGEAASGEDDPYERADGTVIWTRWECRPWYEADGTIGGITVYTEVINQRRKIEMALRASLREKDALLQEIHHRVKNNMQVISSLLSLTAALFRDPDVQEAFRASRVRIRSMAMIHEQLYRSRSLSSIGFAEHLSRLYEHLGQVYALPSG
jgi:PAS domain S-box-containing protein